MYFYGPGGHFFRPGCRGRFLSHTWHVPGAFPAPPLEAPGEPPPLPGHVPGAFPAPLLEAPGDVSCILTRGPRQSPQARKNCPQGRKIVPGAKNLWPFGTAQATKSTSPRGIAKKQVFLHDLYTKLNFSKQRVWRNAVVTVGFTSKFCAKSYGRELLGSHGDCFDT